jgi:hypothetical protein
MTGEWQFVIHQSALETLEGMRGRDRRLVRRCIEELVADPNQRPDAERRSLRDRTLRVKYAGRHCVLYWLDAYVWELRIVAIEEVLFR